MPVVITHEELVFLADPVVEASRRQVLPRVISKHSTVILQLVDEKALHQLVLLRKIRKFGVDRQVVLEHLGARGRRHGRPRSTIGIGQARHLDILPEGIQLLNHLLLRRPRVARWEIARQGISRDRGSGEDRAVRQHGNGILRILPQPFERSK